MEGKNLGGRPKEKPLSSEMFDEMMRRYSDGESIVSLCKAFGFSYMHFDREIKRLGLCELYAGMKPTKARSLRESAIDGLYVEPPLTPDGKVDSGYVQWQKALADVKLRVAESLDPTSQRVDQKISTPDGKNPFSITVDVRR